MSSLEYRHDRNGRPSARKARAAAKEQPSIAPVILVLVGFIALAWFLNFTDKGRELKAWPQTLIRI